MPKRIKVTLPAITEWNTANLLAAGVPRHATYANFALIDESGTLLASDSGLRGTLLNRLLHIAGKRAATRLQGRARVVLIGDIDEPAPKVQPREIRVTLPPSSDWTKDTLTEVGRIRPRR